MPYEIARHAGFCAGVRRAITMARNAARKAKAQGIPCVMLGELIHNDAALNEFKALGVSVAERVEDVPQGAVVIFRSHGEPPQTYADCQARGLTVVDTTCEFVLKLHALVYDHTQKGLPVLLLGDPKHPEIIGIAGMGGDLVYVLSSLQDMEALPALKHPLLVAQTTYPPKQWAETQPTLNRLFPDLEVRRTICPATQLRQDAACELAKRSDAVVVVGGKKSANTRKLYESCCALCPRTCLVECASELPPHFANIHTEKIGIAAGASTPDWSFKEVVTRMNEEQIKEATPVEETAMTEEEKNNQSFMDDVEKTLVRIRNGQTVTGTVVQITDDEVCVNIGYKSDGLIKREDLVDKDVKLGDTIEVEVVKVNDGEGNVLLSQRNIVNRKVWEDLMNKYENHEYVDAVGKEAIKGGLIADVNGVRAFIPASHLAQRYVEKISQFVGQPMKVKIIDVDKQKKRIVASRKEVLAEESAAKKAAAWVTLEEGAVVKGIVRRFADFGAFVDLGGVDGLIHITDLAWSRIGHPSEVLKINDEIEVKILSLDRERERIQLGYKQLQPKPWDNIEEKYPVGSIIERKVVRIRPFGAFVELEPGVDGLVHISQCALTRVAKVEDALQPGQTVRVKILGVDPEAKRISLSVREALADEALNESFDEIPGEELDVEAPAEEAEETPAE